MDKIKQPSVAGQFYPGNKTELEDEVKEYLVGKRENIGMAIVPHAGYMFSGKLAGEVIGRIGKKKDFIILGVNHSGLGNRASFSAMDFSTPLGIVKNNNALGNKILAKLKKEKIDADVSEQAHEHEHSIEVELPFLQVSQESFKIVPILLKELSYEECKKIAEILAGFIDENVCLLVSSDFTHYGKNYEFVPFIKDVRKNLYYLDNEIIINILNLNSKKVYELAKKTTICGVYGITIISEIAKLRKMKAKSVGYYTSGDVVDNWDNVVGYGGVVFG